MKIAKVVAYIIRSQPTSKSTADQRADPALHELPRYELPRYELLVFAHSDRPEVEIQVPGGTIDPGESPEIALFREIEEESGLTAVCLKRSLGMREWRGKQQHYFLLEPTVALPDRWEHQVQGNGLDRGLIFAYFWITIGSGVEIYQGQTGFLSPEALPELFSAQR